MVCTKYVLCTVHYITLARGLVLKNKLAYNQKLLNSKQQDATKLEANSWLPLTKLKPPIKTHPVLNNSES